MATTEEARPGLVLPEYGPTGPELVRRHFGPRGRIVAYAVLALVVAGIIALLVGGGDGLTELKHESNPQFTMLYAAGSVHRTKPGPGEIVRFRAQRRGLRLLVTVRRLTLPPYEGSVAGVLPNHADRQGVLLRFRQSNPPRALGAGQKALAKATRKAFRSFRFGLERK